MGEASSSSAVVPGRTAYAALMLDHLGINVSDYDRSRDFYGKALTPIGFSLMMEPMPHIGGFGRDGNPGSGSPTSASRRP